jgi:hypothetical protein
MGIRTRLTKALGITTPILSAPMGFVAGGKLAAAVTAGGGLGIIGGGYGDADWLDHEFAAAGNVRVGCGFITWSLAKVFGRSPLYHPRFIREMIGIAWLLAHSLVSEPNSDG